jgi:hypothetical protein
MNSDAMSVDTHKGERENGSPGARSHGRCFASNSNLDRHIASGLLSSDGPEREV